jgi:hypothetical protein
VASAASDQINAAIRSGSLHRLRGIKLTLAKQRIKAEEAERVRQLRPRTPVAADVVEVVMARAGSHPGESLTQDQIADCGPAGKHACRLGSCFERGRQRPAKS